MSNKPSNPGFFKRLRRSLNSGNSWLTTDIGELVPRRGKIDDATLETLEDALLMADVGVESSTAIIEALEDDAKRGRLHNGDDIRASLATSIATMLAPVEQPLQIDTQHRPYVILMTGVNGAGKTTTIGKLAAQFQRAGHSVMLAAADTFRAAAVEQLQQWGRRLDVPVIAQKTGADPAAVAFDALEAATARGTDVLLVDTAGRLHTQTGLMDELKKIQRVLGKVNNSAPHAVLLVLDAGTGQNALVQAEQFAQAVALSGLIITKLDGTARGGVLLSIAKRFALPIHFIGVGEQAEDLDVFNAQDFATALVGNSGAPDD